MNSYQHQNDDFPFNDDHHHDHSGFLVAALQSKPGKIFRGSFSAFVALASYLVYFGAISEDESPWLIALAILASMNVGMSFWDHTDFGHDHSHDDAEDDIELGVVSSTEDEASQSRDCFKWSLKILAAIPAGPALYFAGSAVFQQAANGLSKAMPFANNGVGRAITAVFAESYFVAVPVVHAGKRLLGDHRSYSAFATKSRYSGFKNTFYETSAFLLLTGVHVFEGLLLSNRMDNVSVVVMAVLGLSVPNAVSHLDHLACARSIVDTWWNESSVSAKMVTASTAALSGVTHAAPVILGLLDLSQKGVISGGFFWAAVGSGGVLEFVMGGFEHLAHAGREIAKKVTEHGLWGSFKSMLPCSDYCRESPNIA